MDSFYKKSNASFHSNKDSPPKAFSPHESTNSAKKTGFISSLFTKKKPAETGDMEMQQTKPTEGYRSKTKQRLINRKNISDGRIRLNVADTDKVPEDYQIDYKDNPFDALDLNPNRTTSYIENLRSREFSEVNNREVKRFMETQQQKNANLIPQSENLELDLLELDKAFDAFLGKFFRFFQGILPGFCIIHLFLIFAGGSSTQSILEGYVLSGLRVNQIFQVVALLCTVGGFNRYIETKGKYQEAIRNQPLMKDRFRSQLTKHLISAISFLIVYGAIIFNHEFVAQLSDTATSIDEADWTTKFSVFRVLSVVMAIFAIIGWFTMILNSDDMSKYQANSINYSDLTGDEDVDTHHSF